MDLILNIDIKKPPVQIGYKDRIMLVGSCFTEHIGNSLAELKFTTLQNPNGILFDPLSVSKSLVDHIENNKYKRGDLFQLNEIWQTWHHHGRFSHLDKEQCLSQINLSQEAAHNFLRTADWIFITLGSAFSYQLTQQGAANSGATHKMPVANCHRAPAQWFNKTLVDSADIINVFQISTDRLKAFNRDLKIIYTISPVRHIRDGVVENNRSKARLIEAVHQLVSKNDNSFYFPAYELVIDVLRDYRFYDIDLVHPNYMATEYVMEKFTEAFIDEEAKMLMKEIKKIIIASRHKAFHPGSQANNRFLLSHLEKVKEITKKYPFISLAEEMNYFSQNAITL